MDPSSFAASNNAFHLPSSSLSSSYRRSYAAAARASPSHNPRNLSSSFASMSMSFPQPMSFGTSYSKNQVHSLMAARSDAELTQGYECCGERHAGLHELLEHVEDAHPFSDPDESSAPVHLGYTPQVLAMDMEMDGLDVLEEVNETLEREQSGSGSHRSSLSPVPTYALPGAAEPRTGTSPLPLQISEILRSPVGDSALSAHSASDCSSPPDGSIATPNTSTQPSPVFAAPKVNPRGPSSFWPGALPRDISSRRFDRAFNEVVAGKPSPAKDITPIAVAPGVLFGSAAALTTPTTPTVASAPENGEAEVSPTKAEGSLAKPNEPALPQPSLFSTHKPWRCPNPGCNKAYKQSNGLKYHQQKGLVIARFVFTC